MLNMNPYRERDNNLVAMGFKNYRQYLASGLWRQIRARVQGECLRCGRPRTCVHHASYDIETMKGERIDTLVPACRRCHEQAEKAGKGFTDPTERLHAVTLLLMTRFSPLSRSRRRQDKSRMTWTTEKVVAPNPTMTRRQAKARKWMRQIDKMRQPVDMTPRLVRVG